MDIQFLKTKCNYLAPSRELSRTCYHYWREEFAPKCINTVTNYPFPETERQFWWFLGLFGSSWNWIPSFFTIALPYRPGLRNHADHPNWDSPSMSASQSENLRVLFSCLWTLQVLTSLSPFYTHTQKKDMHILVSRMVRSFSLQTGYCLNCR